LSSLGCGVSSSPTARYTMRPSSRTGRQARARVRYMRESMRAHKRAAQMQTTQRVHKRRQGRAAAQTTIRARWLSAWRMLRAGTREREGQREEGRGREPCAGAKRKEPHVAAPSTNLREHWPRLDLTSRAHSKKTHARGCGRRVCICGHDETQGRRRRDRCPPRHAHHARLVHAGTESTL
jgi:hypothetical protein